MCLRFLQLFILFLVTFYSSGQININDQKDDLKKGIYRNFKEFKFNSPSIELNYQYAINTRGYGFLNSSGVVSYGRLIIEKTARKELGMVYGFCDGKNIYINIESSFGVDLKRNTSFNKVEYLGEYTYLEDVISNPSYNGSSTSSLSRKVIKLRNGYVSSLTKSSMRSILSNNTEMLKRFNGESNKKSVLKQYLIEYCEEKKRLDNLRKVWFDKNDEN